MLHGHGHRYWAVSLGAGTLAPATRIPPPACAIHRVVSSLGTKALLLPRRENVDRESRARTMSRELASDHARGPFLVATNCYSRRACRAWWGIALITEAVASSRSSTSEITWVITDGWTYRVALRVRMVAPLTHMILTRLAIRTGSCLCRPCIPILTIEGKGRAADIEPSPVLSVGRCPHHCP